MDIKKAALELRKKLPVKAERDPHGKSNEHLAWMLEGIATGYIQFEKAHRWLGYVQGAMVTKGAAELDDMKQINKDA